MNKKWESEPIRSSDITPEAVYLNRRQFMTGAALVAGGVLLVLGLREGKVHESKPLLRQRSETVNPGQHFIQRSKRLILVLPNGLIQFTDTFLLTNLIICLPIFCLYRG